MDLEMTYLIIGKNLNNDTRYCIVVIFVLTHYNVFYKGGLVYVRLYECKRSG